MKRISRHIPGIIAATAAVVAVSARAENSNTAYNFLDIPTSAHVYALGGNNITIIDEDVSLSDQNPALIGPELEKQVEFNYMLYMASGNFAGLRYGMGVDDHSAFAVGIRYLNYGKFDGYDEFGTPTGAFTPSDLIIEGTYSRDIAGRWRGGANIKMAYSSYENYKAFAIAADLGVNYYDPDHDLSFSILLRNMGGQIKRFTDRYARLPFDIQLGYMQSLGRLPLQISITANNLVRWRIPYYSYSDGADALKMKNGFFTNFFRHLIFGLQYQASDKFYAALAYNYRVASDMSTFGRNILSGFSLGIGFKVKGFKADVAYAMPHKSGSSLVLNLSYTIPSLIYDEE